MTKAMELVQMQIKTNEKDHASLTKATYLGKKKKENKTIPNKLKLKKERKKE